MNDTSGGLLCYSDHSRKPCQKAISVSASYVRNHYGVSYKRGDRLVVDGRSGTLVSFPCQYLGVRFDGEKWTSRCHPTWRVQRESATTTKENAHA